MECAASKAYILTDTSSNSEVELFNTSGHSSPSAIFVETHGLG